VRELFNAIDAAKLEKAMRKPGLCTCPHPCIDGEGQSDLPQLTTTSSNGREVLMPTAYCGLKKAWRKDNQDLVNASTHLVDHQLKTIPDIACFLNQYQPHTSDNDEDDDDEMDCSPGTTPEPVAVAPSEATRHEKGGEPVELDEGETADNEDVERTWKRVIRRYLHMLDSSHSLGKVRSQTIHSIDMRLTSTMYY
jgi:hypothetical protein